MNKHTEINKVLKDFFKNNPNIHKIAAKDLMPDFVKKGIFSSDSKDRPGKPLRDYLRNLDANNQLHLIPYLLADRKTKNTYWYFIPTNNHSEIILTNDKTVPQIAKKVKQEKSIPKDKDETYVLDLCDEVLKSKGSRQHCFDFLIGDAGTKLPVDSYYATLNLVIEYRETQHVNEVKFFDKPDKLTVSGVSRGEQRKMYDQRRRDVLPENGIQLIEINYYDFEHDRKNKIIRNRENDLKVVRGILNK